MATEEQIAEWVTKFAQYRLPPTAAAVRAWVAQFENDAALAEKLLNLVVIVGEQDIHLGYRSALNSIPNWNRDSNLRPPGRWFFLGYGGNGESGQTMLHKFREANGMSDSYWDTLFPSLADLPSEKLNSYDTVVFVDDFSGTGTQVCNYWPRMKEVAVTDAACYLILSAATTAALQKIRAGTTLELIVEREIGETENVFHPQNDSLTDAEKQRVVYFGKKAHKKTPKGFGDCGLTYVFAHKPPNNSLPILHARSDNWTPLFPRILVA